MAAFIPEILQALESVPGDPDTLARVRDLVSSFLPRARVARRVQVAARMLREGTKRRDTAFALQERFGVSRKTSYRYLEAALCQNRPPSDTTQA